jgi:hypothetical protein
VGRAMPLFGSKNIDSKNIDSRPCVPPFLDGPERTQVAVVLIASEQCETHREPDRGGGGAGKAGEDGRVFCGTIPVHPFLPFLFRSSFPAFPSLYFVGLPPRSFYSPSYPPPLLTHFPPQQPMSTTRRTSAACNP